MPLSLHLLNFFELFGLKLHIVFMPQPPMVCRFPGRSNVPPPLPEGFSSLLMGDSSVMIDSFSGFHTALEAWMMITSGLLRDWIEMIAVQV